MDSSAAPVLSLLPNQRRQLGAYYTQGPLPRYLISWALQGTSGRILDPSYGGCAFVGAAFNVLTELGVQDPGAYIFGVDIDPACVKYVAQQPGLRQNHFVTQDFLAIPSGNLGGTPFAAIVGNPPYIRHHWLKGATRIAARRIAERAGVTLPATSSAWAYFILHAMHFLAPTGRIAMLVPEAILQTNYGKAVQTALATRFGKIYLIRIRERLFSGTDESVVVLVASGHGPGTICIGDAKQADEVKLILSKPDRLTRLIGEDGQHRQFSSVRYHDFLGEILQHPKVMRIGDLATVRIGIVTGANDFFLFSSYQLKEMGIPASAVVPIVAKTRWMHGLQYSTNDHCTLLRNGEAGLLCSPSGELVKCSSVREWIAAGERKGLHLRYKCSARNPWFSVPMDRCPDAFATCSRSSSPLLVLNQARIWCTNTLHAIQWRTVVDPAAVAIGFLTTLTAVYAEMYGRRYGGGVLKIEPGLLMRLPVPLLALAPSIFEEFDNLLREGRESEARILADR